MTGCPDPDQVLGYFARSLAVTERDCVEDHLDGCAECREVLGELVRGDAVELERIDPSREIAGGDERYELGAVIGSGGMGDVWLAQDTRIDREVAIKRMQPPLEPARTIRFFREARVQGALEHPAVVPVHDLGIDADGKPYFVMKRLAGTTLAERLARADDRARSQLLDRYVDVCLAVEFAHSRGVIHRDLKPANVMLGDFGETYVIDWGLAHVAGERADRSATVRDERETGDTRTGELLGTLGYMAPEQVRGDTIDSRTDVFALGCILYEILAGTAALPRGGRAVDATLAAVSHRPSERAAVPPELDDLCALATSQNPADRPTARALADTIRAYLDGDRDLERRRELADRHAGAAEAALAGGAGDDARARAMREAGRALALDPEHAGAQALLGAMLLETPSEIPAGALVSSDAERVRMRRYVAQRGAIAYFMNALGVAVLYLFPAQHTWSITVLLLENVMMGVLVLALGRRDLPVRTRWYFVLQALTFAIFTTASLILGPLLVVPMFCIGSLAVWLSLPFGYPPWITVVTHLLAIVPTLLLELAGVLPSTFQIVNDQLVFTANAFDLTPGLTTAMLATAFLWQLCGFAFLIVYTRRIQDAMQDRLHAHTWHLEQLLPRRSGSPRR